MVAETGVVARALAEGVASGLIQSAPMFGIAAGLAIALAGVQRFLRNNERRRRQRHRVNRTRGTAASLGTRPAPMTTRMR
jgi:hypothetical protein